MNEIVNDVRELEAPHPLLSTIEKLRDLNTQSYIHMIHRMEPCVLYQVLDKNGFDYAMKKNHDVHIFIWKKDQPTIEQEVKKIHAL